MNEELRRECDTFSRYLMGQSPSAYVISRYCEFHATPRAGAFELNPFDTFLTGLARRHPFLTCVADTYASRFRKQAAVRSKLVLLLALFESSPPFCDSVDRADPGGKAVLFRLAFQTAIYVFTLMFSTVVLLPAHLLLSRQRNSG